MRDVAIVSFAQTSAPRTEEDDIELLVDVLTRAIGASGIPRKEIGFTVSGSCDFVGGRPFSFVMALDAVGAWPPIAESHVEMDGAWALYEAWVRLQHGDIDSALVYAWGRSSQGDMKDVLVTQLDPYYVAPLAPDPYALAQLQARALVDAKRCPESVLADIAPRKGDKQDGAAAAVLVAGDLARKVCARPAWIRGIDHRIEAHSLGARDLTHSASTALAAKHAGALRQAPDVAMIHAKFPHEEALVCEALGLTPGASRAEVVREGYPLMVSGLGRIGEAATRVHEGKARRAFAHASSGPCLQQNLVCVLEASQ